MLPPQTPTSPFTNPSAMQAYIIAKARSLGLDPRAVLAVAAHEGISLPAQVGDNGTSFGPWQMHFGGVYPSSPSLAPQDASGAQAWANSPAGVDYALTHMAQVARGRSGADAVTNIVYRFERPADPASETANAIRSYSSGQGPKLGGGGGSFLGGVTGFVGDAAGTVNSGLRHIPGVAQVEGAAGAVVSVGDFLAKLTDPHYILRGLQILAGAVLVLAGIVLLTRQVALAADLPDPVGLAAAAASKGAIPPVE